MIIWDGSKKTLKGNLHLHTTLSDGRKTPEEARAIYRAQGYDFISITDHRKVTTETCEKDGLLSLKGIEFDFSMPGQVMHIVGVGVPPEIEEKVQRHFSPQRAIDEINLAGGCAILAHPAWSLNTPDIICSLRGLTAAEIYNTVSAIPWNVDRADSSHILDECFSNGRLINLVASDDTHYYAGDECKSFTVLACEEKSEAAILSALKRGDFYASQGPRFDKIEYDGDQIHVECSPVRTILFPSELTWGRERVFTGDALTSCDYTISRARFQRYVRVMLIDDMGRRAWSNPIQTLDD